MSMPSDPTPYTGKLSDGSTAAAMVVTARLGETGVEIQVPGERRTALVWSYGELRSNVPLKTQAPDVLLSLKPNSSQTLFVADPAFVQGLLARAKGLSAGRQRLAGLRAGVAAVALVLAIGGTVRLLELQPAQTVAKMLPQPTREAMGRSVVAQLTGNFRQCHTPQGRAALDRLTQRLVNAASDNPAPVKVVMVNWGLVNAFAAPGGQIILTRGLVEKAATPDEVAGVLGHEIGHTLELHPEAGLVRAMGLSAAAQLIFAGTTNTATNVGVLLTQLRYTRMSERQADVHALRMLKNAGISSKGFGDFFERLEPARVKPAADAPPKTEKTSLSSRVFTSEILRSHPLTAERLARVRAQPEYSATPALSDEDWKALREICGPAVIQAPRPAIKPGPITGTPKPEQSTGAPPSARPADDPDREIAQATNVLRLNPDDANSFIRRARAYTKKGMHAEALADYTRATELRPSDSNLQVARGGAHYALGQHELALVAYDEAIRLDARNVSALNGRGNTHRALKRYEEALTDFDGALQVRPAFVLGHYNRGLTNVDLGKPGDAANDFTSAITFDKDYAAAFTQRGLLREKAGARDDAISDFRAALVAPVSKYASGPWAHRVARDRLRSMGSPVP